MTAAAVLVLDVVAFLISFLISVVFAGLNICKISEKGFVPVAFHFCSLRFKICVKVMGIFFLSFFISPASGSCIAGERFSYCFI